jgi:hypothetical protein
MAGFWFCARSSNAFASPIAWPPASSTRARRTRSSHTLAAIMRFRLLMISPGRIIAPAGASVLAEPQTKESDPKAAPKFAWYPCCTAARISAADLTQTGRPGINPAISFQPELVYLELQEAAAPGILCMGHQYGGGDGPEARGFERTRKLLTEVADFR